MQTTTHVYLFEFKFNKTAQVALYQIHERKYAGKYQASAKVMMPVGVNFNGKETGMEDWLVEVVV